MKRIILGLLFDGVDFYLSRNFRLQRLGNLAWLKEHFQIFDLTSSVDEVSVFHVGRSLDAKEFAVALAELAEDVFVPISVGGGVRSVEEADLFFRSGADRISFSGTLWNSPNLIREIAQKYGKQSIVVALNYRKEADGSITVRYKNTVGVHFAPLMNLSVDSLEVIAGELILQSIDRDGTGQGFPAEDLLLFDRFSVIPWVVSGGFGAIHHVSQSLGDPRIQAVLTSNLLAFVGTGLENARKDARFSGVHLADWNRWNPSVP